jgi:oligopeptide transport system ATP-binding protein
MLAPESSLLRVENLSVSFNTHRAVNVWHRHHADVNAPVVDRVSLDVRRSQTVALVGESGCGKSVTALSIMRLLPSPPARIVSGKIRFHNSEAANDEQTVRVHHSTIDNQQTTIEPSRRLKPTARVAEPLSLLTLPERDMRRIRGGRIAMIFQEPLTSLNPVFTIGEQVIEAIELHQPVRGKQAREQAVEMLHRVGIPDPQRRIRDYPHQLSGGMRQRVMIAMALACEPVLLIADEPTTALDVTTQAQILDLLRRIQSETGMSLLLITHDLGVVSEVADYVYVMYSGRIIEHAKTAELFADPLHPYTKGLMRCTPRLGPRTDLLEVIPGVVPNPSNPPTGCRFHPRCPLSAERARCYIAEERSAGSQGKATERRSDEATIALPEGGVVLRRCVERFDGAASGVPELRAIRPRHYAACWEI